MMHSERPPLGFIVEGRAEYHCYPSLYSRISPDGPYIPPPYNARGNGQVLFRLDQHLRRFVRLHAPLNLFICLDLKDALQSGKFSDCKDVFNHISSIIDGWRQQPGVPPEKMPEGFIIIIVIPKFESWVLSDIKGVRSICTEPELVDEWLKGNWENIDEEVRDPCTRLKKIFPDEHIKSPHFLRRIISKNNIENMEKCSLSFEKFSKEIRRIIDEYFQNIANS